MSTTHIYLIHKKGVYSHGVHGVYTFEAEARALCTQQAEADCDEYHTWEVLKVPVEQMHEDATGDGYRDVVFSCTKKV